MAIVEHLDRKTAPLMENEDPHPNCVLEVSTCFCEKCCKKIEKRFSKIKGVMSVVAEPKKKWVHIAGTADLCKLIHAIEKKGRKVEVIYYCKMNISNFDEPTKEADRHGKTKDGAEKHYSSSSTKSTGKNSFHHHDKDFGYEDSEGNGNDEYEDPHARYKSRVHKRESYSAASRAAPPSPSPHMRGFGDDFMDPDVAYHLRIMRSTVPQSMCHSGYMYVQPPCYGGGSGGYYGGGTYPAAYQAAPRPYHQYGYSPHMEV